MNKKLTRHDLIQRFREDHKEQLQAKPKDYPLLRTAWNDMVDALVKQEQLPSQARNWSKPIEVEPRQYEKKDYVTVDIYPNKPTITVRRGKEVLCSIKNEKAALVLSDYYRSEVRSRVTLINYLVRMGLLHV